MTDTMPANGPAKPRKTHAVQRSSVRGWCAGRATKLTEPFEDDIATFMALEKPIAAVARIAPK